MLRAVAPSSLSVTSQNAAVVTAGGLTMALSGTVFVGTAQAVTSGTSASSWVPTGVGPSGASTPTIPANYMVPGKTLRLRVMGTLVTAATPGTLNLSLALGSSTLWSGGPQTPTASISQLFALDVVITCQTAGAGGTCSISGQLAYNTGLIAGVDALLSIVSTGVALNTTVSNLLALTTTNSISGGAVFTINTFLLESLN